MDFASLICNISDIKLINTTTVRAQAANELRDRILTGRLQPGDRLDLDQLTAEFGISRTPIREALLELSYEGLVAITPRSGISVVGITPQDAIDNFAILAALAGKAAEMATERITGSELGELHRLAERQLVGFRGKKSRKSKKDEDRSGHTHHFIGGRATGLNRCP